MRSLKSRPTKEATAYLARLEARRLEAENGGPPLTAAEIRGYAHEDVKLSLIAETHGKCGYCESPVTHVYWGDVEHIWPKDANCRPDLRFSYDNLTFACALCNNAKRAYCDQQVPLVNPYVDNPEIHFLWLGPTTWPINTSPSAEVTLIRLALNRLSLVEQRQERLTIYTRSPAGINRCQQELCVMHCFRS